MSDPIRPNTAGASPASSTTVNPSTHPVGGAAGPVTAGQLEMTAHSGPISDSVWDTAVNEWLNTAMRNTAMSGSTEAWNHLLSQLPELRKLLEGQIGG